STAPVRRAGEPDAPADPAPASPPVLPPARNTAEGQAVEFAFAAVRLPAEHRALVRYELTVRQAVSIPFDAIVSFSPRADSAEVSVDGVPFSTYSWLRRDGIPIPFAHAGAEIRILAWSSVQRDSATVRIMAWPPSAGEH